jgi:hypothetical protein
MPQVGLLAKSSQGPAKGTCNLRSAASWVSLATYAAGPYERPKVTIPVSSSEAPSRTWLRPPSFECVPAWLTTVPFETTAVFATAALLAGAAVAGAASEGASAVLDEP